MRFKTGTSYLLWGAISVNLSMTAGAEEAAPAAARDAGKALIEEIIVSAQRREEGLQAVPVAVSAFTDTQRDLIGVTNANDIAKFTPGMEFNLNRVVIRGIGRTTSALGTDPGVATYYDGVYSDNAGSIGGAPIAVERVEVLRGPQGTLYGRNSIGGAINVISKRPTDTFEGEFRLKLGNYETYESALSLSGPITDWLRSKLVVQRNLQRQGFVENTAGEGRNDRDQLLGEIQFEADLTEDAQLWIQYSNATWDQGSILGVAIDPYDITSPRINALIPNVLRGYTASNPSVHDRLTVSENYPGSFELLRAPKATVQLDWDLGSTKLKYIGGWYRAETVLGYDFDGSSRDGFISAATGAQISSDVRVRANALLSGWSNELQLSSDVSGPWYWIVGAYQGHDDNSGDTFIHSPDQAELNNVLSLSTFSFAADNPDRNYLAARTRLKGDSYAAYAQTEYAVTPEWTITAGLRHTWDKKEGAGSGRLIYFDPEGNGALAALLGPTLGYSVELATPSMVAEEKWDGTTAKLGFRWEPAEDVMAYGTVSTGYKAGGFNLGAFSSTPIDPEHVLAYELGMKANPTDSLQVNTALYYNDYEDIQVLGNVNFNGVPTAALFNASQARSYGVEAEVTWVPVEPLRFLLVYSYLNAEFTKFDQGVLDPNQPNGPDRIAGSGDEFQVLTGNRMQGSPRHKVALNTLYRMNVLRGTLALSGTYTWTDDVYYSIFNTPTYLGEAHGEADFRATWSAPSGSYDVIGYIANAFDERYATNIGLTSTSTGRVWQPGDPRTYGIQVIYRF